MSLYIISITNNIGGRITAAECCLCGATVDIDNGDSFYMQFDIDKIKIAHSACASVRAFPASPRPHS